MKNLFKKVIVFFAMCFLMCIINIVSVHAYTDSVIQIINVATPDQNKILGYGDYLHVTCNIQSKYEIKRSTAAFIGSTTKHPPIIIELSYNPSTGLYEGSTLLTDNIAEDYYDLAIIDARDVNWNYNSHSLEIWKDTSIRIFFCDQCKKNGHTISTTITNPTCSKSGEKISKCKFCNYIIDRTTLQRIPHSYDSGTIIKESTCISDGLKEFHCINCNNVKTEYVEKIPHSWNDGVVIIESTCDKTGTEVYTCKECGATKQEIFSAAGHKWNTSYTVDRDATCISEGVKSIHCSKCNQIKDGSAVKIPATGHTWDSGIVTTQETCTKDGIKTYTCKICGSTKETTIKAIGHNWNAWQTVSKATVFAPEEQKRTCGVCGIEETKSVGNKVTPTIRLNYTSLTLKVGQSTSVVKVSGLALGDSVKSWKSSNTKVVKVDSKGKITAQKSTGKATIMITLASGKKAKVYVNVQKSTVKTKKITGIKPKISLKKGQRVALKPVLSPITSTEKITYSSSNTQVVTVDSKGVIKGIKKGKALIYVKSGNIKFKCTVTVK